MAKKEEIAELVADHFGRPTIDADYELAAEILRRVGYDEDESSGWDASRPATTEAQRPGHLEVTTTDRGFQHLPPIPSSYGGEVAVYESSAASGPHLWLKATAPVDLNEPDGPTHSVPAHLTIEDAEHLADQLHYLITNHYQRPF